MAELNGIPKPVQAESNQVLIVDDAVAEQGIPRPVAWGTYKSDPNTHFYLCEFMDMIEELPDIRKFSAMLAKLHHNSMADIDAPKEFGFHVMTHEGSMYQDISWCKTWEEMYACRFQSFIDQERVSQGPSEELEEILPEFISKIIPRLLRPLGTHGRTIKPVALHADIWYGNLATNAATGEPVYFDPSVFWGHNECDVGIMATPGYRLGRHWMREYHKFFPISAPEEDYEDRNLLYAHVSTTENHSHWSFQSMSVCPACTPLDMSFMESRRGQSIRG
ncbi:hypothetical protein QQS21_005179 [Conoideocrella luteorostrata]|uniref:protein-ribulosamine 3-kinase n=1 Tax=Conoideocrella luteorostrata TaxID=1105319 RepID=A0AAJ0CPX4_9HYPO|nr:hypothetical protein QQS21_005179 [Conoideocrella luteorostrata]